MEKHNHHFNYNTINHTDKDPLNPNEYYNLSGIPYHRCVNVNEINFIKGNVIIDKTRAIILKPITRERIVEVMVEEVVEKIVNVPQVQIVDKYVEVVKPVVKYKIKEVKRPVTVERIKKIPKFIEEEKILEVPEIQYVDKYVDVPKIVHKEKIIEIPLPMVRERRIPILNVSRNERFEEIDAFEYDIFSGVVKVNKEKNNQTKDVAKITNSSTTIKRHDTGSAKQTPSNSQLLISTDEKSEQNTLNGMMDKDMVGIYNNESSSFLYMKDGLNNGNNENAIKNVDIPNIGALAINSNFAIDESNRNKIVSSRSNIERYIYGRNTMTTIDRMNNLIQINKTTDGEPEETSVSISMNNEPQYEE